MYLIIFLVETPKVALYFHVAPEGIISPVGIFVVFNLSLCLGANDSFLRIRFFFGQKDQHVSPYY